jgi:hypothetical protein
MKSAYLSTEGLFAADDGHQAVRVAAYAGAEGVVARTQNRVGVASGQTAEVYVGKDGVWTKQTAATLEGSAVSISLDETSDSFAVGVTDPGNTVHVEQFDLQGNRRVLRPPHDKTVRMALQLDAQRTVACGAGGEVWLWRQDALLGSLAMLTREACFVGYDGQRLLIADDSGQTGLVSLANDKLSLETEAVGAQGMGVTTKQRTTFEYITFSPARWSRHDSSGLQLANIELLRGAASYAASSSGSSLIVDEQGRAWSFTSPGQGQPGDAFETAARARSRYLVRADRLVSE